MALAGVLFDALSGVLFVALGVVVALVRPWRALKSFFGLYAIGLGVLVVALNLPHVLAPGAEGRVPDGESVAVVRLVASAGGLVASLALAGIGWRIARRRGGHHALLASAGLGLLLVVVGLGPQVVRPWDASATLTTLGAVIVSAGTHVVVLAASVATLMAVALAALATSRDAPSELPRLAFLSLGIAPFAAFASGDSAAYRLAAGDAPATGFALLCIASLFAVAAVWALVMRRARPEQRRWVGVLVAGVPLLVLAGFGLTFLQPDGNTGAGGVARTASVLVLAYATLRHDLFGVTPRLQTGLKRGTIGMAFAAAFLVGGTLGEAFLEPPYDLIVSMASMAALLVALEPLRRAADRLADSAARATSAAGPQEVAPPAPGVVVLGRYEVEQRLGEGGNGTTFLCHDRVLGRPVVAKALPVRPGLARHLDEARSLAKIRHPHVVQVFDAGQEGAYGYVITEYVAGGSLGGRLARGPLAHDELARLADGVLSALGACHANGIVHGDVKPENVLLDEEGHPRLADFGSARALGRGHTARADPFDATLLFMAPEQVRGGAPTPASDLHAAAVLLATAAAGAHPLVATGMDDFAIRYGILTAPPRLEGVPEGLRPVLERALEKDPAARFPDAATMREATLVALSQPAGPSATAGRD